MDKGDCFILGVLMGVLIVGGVIGLIFLGDATDAVNSNIFGQKLCESKNLIYSHRTWLEGYEGVPVIHCKKNVTNAIYDGVVVVDKGMRK